MSGTSVALPSQYKGPAGFLASAIVGLVLVGSFFWPTQASAQVALGTAGGYAVLAGTTVTNTGPSAVTGDLGVSPGTAVTGFPPGVVNGTIHAADGSAGQAKTDVTTAYNSASALACNTVLTGVDLGGLTLTPGVYCFASGAGLTGILTLNYQGNPNAIFVFRIGSALITANGSSVVTANTAGNSCQANVTWQVGSSATLGAGTSFAGNILASTAITLDTGAQLAGRALTQNGAVTLDDSAVTPCTAPPIVTGAAAGIPTLAEWAMILLSMALALVGMGALRQRKV